MAKLVLTSDSFEDLDSVALDLRSLLTIAQAMQDDVWGFANMATLWRDSAAPFNDGLTFALGEMSERVQRLQAVITAASSAAATAEGGE